MFERHLISRSPNVTQPQHSKVAARRKPAQAATSLHAYEVKEGSDGALPEMRLPKGAVLAIIPSSAAVAKELESSAAYQRTPWIVDADLITYGADGKISVVSAKIGKSAFEPDARARAVLRGVEYAQADLREAGGAYELEEVRTLLHGVSRQAIDKKVKEGGLLSVQGPSNRRRFPTLQFNDDGSVVEGLAAVQKALGFGSPWSVLNFLINPHDVLQGDKPIERLRRGDVDLVVEAARGVGVQGA